MAGNSTSTGGVGVTVDNFAPTVSVSGLPANVSGSVSVSASASSDTATVAYEARLLPERRLVGDRLVVGRLAVADRMDAGRGRHVRGAREGDRRRRQLRHERRRDDPRRQHGSERPPDRSGRRRDRRRNGQPRRERIVDSGSGVASVVAWQAQTGGGGFADIASDSSAPYDATWSVGGLLEGAYDLRIVVTDLAGNSFTSAPITVDVDATAPGVTLNNPGSRRRDDLAERVDDLRRRDLGDVAQPSRRGDLDGDRHRRVGAVYGASSEDHCGRRPLRPPRRRHGCRRQHEPERRRRDPRRQLHPGIVVSSVPANGSIAASASQIAITASEDIAALTGVTLDGAATAAPTISGATATFNTGTLANGTHTLTGTVRDAANNSSAFSITFMVGVPALSRTWSRAAGRSAACSRSSPPRSTSAAVPESDGLLTLHWTPSQNAKGQPYATIPRRRDRDARIRPGRRRGEPRCVRPERHARLLGSVTRDADGHASVTSQKLRSTSNSGKTLEEATAILRDRGFELGTVRGVAPSSRNR